MNITHDKGSLEFHILALENRILAFPSNVFYWKINNDFDAQSIRLLIHFLIIPQQ